MLYVLFSNFLCSIVCVLDLSILFYVVEIVHCHCHAMMLHFVSITHFTHDRNLASCQFEGIMILLLWVFLYISLTNTHTELGINPRVELLVHQLYTLLVLADSAMQFYSVVLPISTHTNRLWEFWVLHILKPYIVYHFYFNYSGICFIGITLWF